MKATSEQDERLQRFTELSRFLRDIGAKYDDIWLGFWDFKLTHPEVEERLREFALKAKSRGLARYGIGALWEVLRWHVQVVDGRVEEFACSNSYRSRYARYLMWKYADLRGFFELRPLRASEVEE